jgi:heptosyltransferase-2
MIPPEKILVRGVNWLGDAVMTTPALMRLREAKPSAHLTLLTPAKLADLWCHHPAVDSVVTFKSGESVFTVARRLREGNFSTAMVLPNSPRSALEVFLARIPRRFGLARPWRSLLLTDPVPALAGIRRMRKRSKPEILRLTTQGDATLARRGGSDYTATDHQMRHYLHLVSALGANPEPVPPRLEVTPEEVQAIMARFGFPASGGIGVFGLNAGAEYGPAKRWPRERFIAAAVELQRRTSCHWWVLGGKADEPLAAGITAEIAAAKAGSPDSVKSLAGQTSLRELCAALKACDLVLTNDTGPMHVAAALGTPVVVPFGSTSPELTGPGFPGDPRHRFIKANVPCSPCFLRECPIDFRCMNGISVDAVVAAVLEAMPEHGSRI